MLIGKVPVDNLDLSNEFAIFSLCREESIMSKKGGIRC